MLPPDAHETGMTPLLPVHPLSDLRGFSSSASHLCACCLSQEPQWIKAEAALGRVVARWAAGEALAVLECRVRAPAA